MLILMYHNNMLDMDSNKMNITYKPMKLTVKKIDHEKYRRTITNLEGSLIWDGGEQFYVFQDLEVMNAERMHDLIEQMKKLPFWNIVEVENDFA
jgi:glycosylphosphatidylinositol transamidase (GPIT) subunit GPI8